MDIAEDSIVKLLPYEILFERADLIITLGGDGTLLHIAAKASEHSTPVLGINIGHLGYMTELEINELDKLSKLFDGSFTVESRIMLDVSVIREENKLIKFCALNDAVISYGTVSRIITFSLFCDKKKATDYRADGIILSTPTGSTAYSLSAGGPIIEPSVSAITATPICPHSLSSKSIVFSDTSVLDVEISPQNVGDIYLTVDGENNYPLQINDRINIRKSNKQFSLIKINDFSFFEILNKKFSEGGH